MNGQTMKSTPGPWIVSIARDVRVMHFYEDGGVRLVAICDDTSGKNAASLANAALISIAPDMLEALIAIQESAINAINGTIDANPVAAMISEIFEKLVNEAGIG